MRLMDQGNECWVMEWCKMEDEAWLEDAADVKWVAVTIQTMHADNLPIFKELVVCEFINVFTRSV